MQRERMICDHRLSESPSARVIDPDVEDNKDFIPSHFPIQSELSIPPAISAVLTGITWYMYYGDSSSTAYGTLYYTRNTVL